MARFMGLLVIALIILAAIGVYLAFFNAPTAPAPAPQAPQFFSDWRLSPKAVVVGSGTWTESQAAWTFNAKNTGEVAIDFYLSNVGYNNGDCTTLTASPGVVLTKITSFGQVAYNAGDSICDFSGHSTVFRMDVPSPSTGTTYTVYAKNGQDQMQIIHT